MLRACVLCVLACAAAAAADARWATFLALPNITSIETTVTTGDERYLDVLYNGEESRETFLITPDLTLDDVVLPEGLRKFSLTRVNLAALPDGFQWPSTVDTIDLSSNALTSVPTDLMWPDELKTLSLANNHLADCVANLPASVTSLDLGENELSCIDQCEWPDALEALTLSGNPLNAVEPTQSWPAQLKELRMDNTQLDSVPPNLPSCLQQLHLTNNHIAAFPKNLPSSLESLSLSYNSIKSVPAALDRFPNLSVLQLDNNQLTSLPAKLALPTGFRMLSLSNNMLKSLPANCNSWLANIEISIELDGNQLTALPSNVQFPDETNLANNKIKVLQNMALPKTFRMANNPLERISRVRVADGSFWQTSPATLKSFSMDDASFAVLENMMYGFSSIEWTVDAKSAAAACKAESGVLKPLNDGKLRVCVVPGARR
ncbi:hypothetical protein H310_01786 [Aphanomyces invadans]|uniref:Uncharacterized protein n=1 Tax=Aphanomyces invadans TaxID=157072 RepID=A0A024UMR5_9STRA|nr:hypothetical protein H310_01786 [Aphanomyces invadans]ETW07157.1 hypothetical protein H310_01786 [Aphanomyces invadans]|eukprot:XP_008863250.1 hypothetical protein H310_01786 [Aphanomyces invadans]